MDFEIINVRIYYDIIFLYLSVYAYVSSLWYFFNIKRLLELWEVKIIDLQVEISNVLQRIGLNHAIPAFEKDKITPAIVCLLPRHGLALLVVQNETSECIKYGNSLFVDQIYDTDKFTLEILLVCIFKPSDIVGLCVSNI